MLHSRITYSSSKRGKCEFIFYSWIILYKIIWMSFWPQIVEFLSWFPFRNFTIFIARKQWFDLWSRDFWQKCKIHAKRTLYSVFSYNVIRTLIEQYINKLKLTIWKKGGENHYLWNISYVSVTLLDLFRSSKQPSEVCLVISGRALDLFGP